MRNAAPCQVAWPRVFDSLGNQAAGGVQRKFRNLLGDKSRLDILVGVYPKWSLCLRGVVQWDFDSEDGVLADPVEGAKVQAETLATKQYKSAKQRWAK